MMDVSFWLLTFPSHAGQVAPGPEPAAAGSLKQKHFNRTARSEMMTPQDIDIYTPYTQVHEYKVHLWILN